MIFLTQAGLTSSTSLQFERRESIETSVIKKSDDNVAQTLSDTSTTVSLSAKVQRSHTFVADGVEKYQAIGGDVPTSQAAGNILSFIAARLKQDKAESASHEDIESRLQAAYEGFTKGYNEAYQELSEVGLLSVDVENAIERTFSTVINGIGDLAKLYDVRSPLGDVGELMDIEVPEQPVTDDLSTKQPMQVVTSVVDRPLPASPQAVFAQLIGKMNSPTDEVSSLIEASTFNYESLSQRNFSFTLKTQDGDSLLITASAMRGEQGSARGLNHVSDNANYRTASFSTDSFFSNTFNIQVDGELDENELRAIDDLLGQVGDLSATFFSGDVEAAFNAALNIGFDETEINRFSLDLKQEAYTKVEVAYGRVMDLSQPISIDLDTKNALDVANRDTLLTQLLEFIKMLQEAANKADQLGVDRAIIPDFANYLAKTQLADHQGAEKLAPLVEKMVSHLP